MHRGTETKQLCCDRTTKQGVLLVETKTVFQEIQKKKTRNHQESQTIVCGGKEVVLGERGFGAAENVIMKESCIRQKRTN